MSVNPTIKDLSVSTSVVGHASWLVPARVESPELLDKGAGTTADVKANLAEMWCLNRYLGGFQALTRHLYPRILSSKSPITIIDLGTGSAQELVAITRWARANTASIYCIGLDYAARNLAVARSRAAGLPEITLLHANALCLPVPPNSADYVISSLFLHHFSPEQVIDLLGAAFATARRGIIMTDLVRGWLPLVGYKLIQPIFARNYLTRHDGAISIRRAYTPIELYTLAQAAGLSEAHVHTHFPWRMTLVVDK